MHKRLKEIRKQMQLRQCDVAKLLDICTATYNRYEKGVLNLDAIRLTQIADIYGVSVDYLLMRTDIPRMLNSKKFCPNSLATDTDYPTTKQEDIDFLFKYTALGAQSKGAINALLEYEYLQTKKNKDST